MWRLFLPWHWMHHLRHHKHHMFKTYTIHGIEKIWSWTHYTTIWTWRCSLWQPFKTWLLSIKTHIKTWNWPLAIHHIAHDNVCIYPPISLSIHKYRHIFQLHLYLFCMIMILLIGAHLRSYVCIYKWKMSYYFEWT
jgi:hypothetical protein